jgi:copper transport protein
MANVLDPELHPGKFSGLLGVLLVIVSIGASGHAAAGGLLISSVFVVHVLVVGIWFGALWLLYRGISLDRAGIVNDMLMRFSTRAVWMVSLLLFTAVFLAIYQLGNVVNLFSSEYGNWLMIKIILVLLVLALAAVNKWKLTPALQEQNGAPRRNLSRSIVSEGILMVIVVAITSVLASTPPPDRETSRLLTLSAGGTDLELRISPARTGENDIGLSFIRGDEPFSPMEVDVFWEQPEAGIEPMSREAVRTGEGQYRVDNVDLLVDGDWQFQVEVLIDDFTRERFETELDVEE